jgi:hypothetical protein
LIKPILALLLPFALGATELAPWYGRSLEIEPRATALFQYFRSIATPFPQTKYISFGQFYTLSAASSYDRVGAEVELTMATTPVRTFGFDAFRATGRYLLLDDVIGDWISITAGTTLSASCRPAVRDISAFHHGNFEIEGHLAFGKECSCHSFWVSRWWGLFALGMASRGCPWMRTDFTLERNFWDCSSWQVFVHTLWGCGDYNIDLRRGFEGYGLIKHRSVDLGFRASTLFGSSGGIVSFQIAQRLYAWNFPKYATLAFLRFTYPFGL